MVKADLVERVFERTGFPKKEVAKAIDVLFEIIKEAVKRGEKVRVHGFGSFWVKEVASRKRRHPRTGQEIETTSRKAMVFKPSYSLRVLLNRSLR